MQIKNILISAIVPGLLIISSCGTEEKQASPAETTNEAPASTPMASPIQATPITPTPAPADPGAQGVGVEFTAHYTCANHCKGSGSEAEGTCPVCGSAYQHNQNSLFHQRQAQAQQPPQGQPVVDPNKPKGN